MQIDLTEKLKRSNQKYMLDYIITYIFKRTNNVCGENIYTYMGI